ncbi:hypothetical protein BH09BAC5_BH09BAC5_13980 [soil metagenome]
MILKQFFLFIYIFLFLPSEIFGQELNTVSTSELKRLLIEGEYFQFSENMQSKFGVIDSALFSKSDGEDLFLLSWERFLFNKPLESNFCIEKLLHSKIFPTTDSVEAELLQLHFQNDLRLFHYKTADSICTLLLFQYSSVLSAETKLGIKNTSQITAALENIPPQTIERNGDVDIKFSRDLANLIRIPVEINSRTEDYIFDTGANFSTMSESEAKKAGVKILDADFGVTSSSRTTVNSKIGVAEQIQIGNAVFHNVVFLILPDKSLKFAGGIYKIKGIIGFPVISQFQEIQIHKNGHFISPQKQTESELQNLGVNGNTPFVNVSFYGTYHPYIFDTGAAAGILSEQFQKTYSDSLKNFSESTSHVGGAGGVQKISTLRIENLPYKMGGKSGKLKRATVQLSGASSALDGYNGLVGEDIFTQWELMTINFDKMFVLLIDK